MKNLDQTKDIRIRQLERDLLQAREELRRITERGEGAKEEDRQNNENTLFSKDLTREKELTEALLANNRTPFLMLDKQLVIKKANHSFQRIYGFGKSEIQGNLIYNLGNGQWNIPALKYLLEEILPDKKNVADYEIRHRFDENDERALVFNAQQVGDGEVDYLILLSIEDITWAKQSAESNAMLAAIVASSEDAIISKTLQGIITSWNNGAEKLFGYESAEMIGQHIFKVIPKDRIIEEPEIIRKISAGETIAHFETQRLTKDGSLIDISLTISPIKDAHGKIIGASKIARDITRHVNDRKKMEESEKRFHQLIYSSPSAIGILNGKDLIITIANEPIKEIFGKGNEIIGQKFFDVMPELIGQGYPEIFGGVLKTGKPFNGVEIPVRLMHDGEETVRYYNFILYPQYDLNNNIMGIGIIASDVTSDALRNKQIKESEERFRSLTETLPQLIWVTDSRGNAEFASSRWEEYSGIDPSAENAWADIMHPDELEDINAAWAQCLKTGIAYKFEVRLKSKAGEYRWHTVAAEAIKNANDEIVKWVGAFTDIHHQKVKEEQKDEFMGIASHEMKTPLTTAKAYLQMLELSIDDSDKETKLFAVKASQSVDKLNELIGELLDVSKIQFGKLNYTMTHFNFNEMIQNTVEIIQLTAPAIAIVKTGQVSRVVMGDKDRLQQVFINLLSNAIKYSPLSKEVKISYEEEDDNIKIAIADKGIGIAKENLNKIFDKYHRVEEHAIQFQGMGVGLFISHEIIQRHGGKLWVESEVGKGSTFYVTLPLNDEHDLLLHKSAEND